MISKERVEGFLKMDYRGCGEDLYLRFSIIPAVWCWYLLHGECGYWKENLGFGESLADEEMFEPFYLMEGTRREYSKLEENALKDWAGFEKAFQKLQREEPEKIRSIIPRLVRAIPDMENHGFLWFECGFCQYHRGGGLISLDVENPNEILDAVRVSRSLEDSISERYRGNWVKWNYIPCSEIDDSCLVGVQDWDWKSLGIDGIAIPAKSSRTAPAPSLVPMEAPCTAPAGMVPAFIYGEEAEIQGSVADVKRDTTLTEIKKQNGLLEKQNGLIEKQNGLTEKQNGLIEQLIGTGKQTVHNTGAVAENSGRLVESSEQTARNTGKIATNFEKIMEHLRSLPDEEIEFRYGVGKRRQFQSEYKRPPMTLEQIWEYENPGRTLEGLNVEERKKELNLIRDSIRRAKEEGGPALQERVATFKQLKNNYSRIMECRAEFWFLYCRPKGEGWKRVYEAEHGRRCDLTGEDLESERNNYEKSIRAFRRKEYDDFKSKKKER